MGLIEKAVEFATAKHAGQKRKYTEEPYIEHPLAVAGLVKSTGARDAVIAAAILHDVLEDTDTSVTEMLNKFGEEVTKIVIELTDVFISGAGYGNRAERKKKEAERLAKISPEAQTIKVADLIDNTKSIVERDPGFAKVYLKEKAAVLAVMTKADPVLLAKAKESI
jgi:(p)ppGpp synthase/HD superfamily hydrolase